MNGDSSALDRACARVGRQFEQPGGDMNLRAMAFGPAYLDRVLRVDRPLVAPALGPPIDQSVDGSLGFAGGRNLELTDPSGYTIEIALPPGWPGPSGRIELERGIRAGATAPISVFPHPRMSSPPSAPAEWHESGWKRQRSSCDLSLTRAMPITPPESAWNLDFRLACT
jgi:hypothetical protein